MSSVWSNVDLGHNSNHKVQDVVPVVCTGVPNTARVIDDETDVQQTRSTTQKSVARLFLNDASARYRLFSAIITHELFIFTA